VGEEGANKDRRKAPAHHSEPAGHVVHDPVDGFEGAVQQRVGVGEAVEVQRGEQQPAVAPQLQQPAGGAAPLGRPATAASLQAAPAEPAQSQSHGPGELPPPAAAARTHATSTSSTSSSPTHSAFHTHTHTQTHGPTVENAGRVEQQLFVAETDVFQRHRLLRGEVKERRRLLAHLNTF